MPSKVATAQKYKIPIATLCRRIKDGKIINNYKFIKNKV